MRQFPSPGRHAGLAAIILALATLGVTFVGQSVFAPRILGADSQPDGVAILKSRCFGCHNSKTAQGKLDLTSRESALRGGERGPAMVAGKARESLIYQFASQQVRPFMPPSGERVSPDELKILGTWIDDGARWPDAAALPHGSLFTSTIKPLLEQKCVNCHHPGAGKASGLDLTSREKLLEGGDHGPAVVLDNPESSALVSRLMHIGNGAGMPFNQPKLPEETIAKVVSWVRDGAKYDAPIGVATTPVKSDHWAFQKPVKAPLPKLTGALGAWSKNGNPVDVLLAAKWQEKGLTPSPETDRRTLLRRLHIDVTGLPPKPEEIDAFLKDR